MKFKILISLLLITTTLFSQIDYSYLKRDILEPYNYKIILPDLDYPYFLNSRVFPFEKHNSEFSLINAWWLSEISFLTYASHEFVKKQLNKAGFPNVRFFAKNDSEGMLTWNDDLIIISFRGTEMKTSSLLPDVLTDVNTIPADFELGGKVHRGFLTAYHDLWDGPYGMGSLLNEIKNDNKDRTIWLTGHSLGAAIATICFTNLREATALYTIGSPRVGDQDFANLTKDRPIFRLVNNKDPFTLTPPSIPYYDFYFIDVGELIFLDANGNIHNKRSRSTHNINDTNLLKDMGNMRILDINIIKDIRAYTTYIGEKYEITQLNIFDHMPIYYSLKIWNNLIKKKEIKN